MKWHINNDNIVGVCTAKPGGCPFGGNESHFDNKEQAEQENQRRLGKAFPIIDKVKSADTYVSKEEREKYHKELRGMEVPRPEFNYDRKELEAFKGEFVQVEYDGEFFDGKVVDTSWGSKVASKPGLILESPRSKEYKHIKLYRLTSLKVVDSVDKLREFVS